MASITRKEIGELLLKKYPTDASKECGNKHIRYFYFEVQVSNSCSPVDIETCQATVRDTLNKECKGNSEWKLVDEMTVVSPTSFTFHFFGNYEDGIDERCIEKKLDGVRYKLEQDLKSASVTELEATCHIIITRACMYHHFEIPKPGEDP